MQMRGECGDDEMTEMDERVGVAVTICSGPMNGKGKKMWERERKDDNIQSKETDCSASAMQSPIYQHE